MLIRNPRGPVIRLVMIAAAIGLFVVGYQWGNRYKQAEQPPAPIEGVLVRPPPELPGFALRDAENRPFTTDSFTGHWTLLAFVNPSRAPGQLAVARMIEVHNRMAKNPELQAMLQLALITDRRYPILARDFGRLSPYLKLLSGESGEIQRLRATFGAPAASDRSMDVGDDTAFYLIGPASRLLALFPGAQPPASIASDLSAIAEHPQPPLPNND